MPTTPRVSIVVPAYNHEQFAGASLEALLNQTFGDFELIVVDDGSQDGTAAICEGFKDKRVRVIRLQRNQGISVASAAGLSAAKGEYVAWTSSDDLYHPDGIGTLVAALDASPRTIGAFGQCSHVSASGQPLDGSNEPVGVGLTREEKLARIFWRRNPFCAPTALLRRETMVAAGGFSPCLLQLNDVELWTRLLFRGDLIILPDRILSYRLSGNNVSAAGEATRKRLDLEYLQVLSHYFRNIDSFAQLISILPEASDGDVHPGAAGSMERVRVQFQLARLCLKTPFASHRFAGLNKLSQLLADPATEALLKEEYSFGYPDLFQSAGSLDVFADTEEMAIMRRDMESYRSANQDLERQLIDLQHTVQEMTRTKVWKVVEALRSCRRLVSLR